MPQAINEVKIEGNLTRDAETKYTNSGKQITHFSLAYNSAFKKGEDWIKEVSYFDVTAWGNDAASALRKGDRVYIEGKLKQDRWEKDGKTNSKVGIVAFKVEKRSNPEGQPSAPKAPKPAPEYASGNDFTDDIDF